MSRNWGLTDPELKTIPPALVRGFKKDNDKRLRLGSELGGNFGRSLMRGAFNSELYGPLQDEYLKGQKAGSDFWINKNRYDIFGLLLSLLLSLLFITLFFIASAVCGVIKHRWICSFKKTVLLHSSSLV